ncbi:DUF4129 domain-containing protein [Pseudofrankia sp. DC12]|uniref:DUF4129 domain-containing protein n=1 Tax=Pseudofrankia sp. DC12 TaxID=683315 RepID=UPI0005F78E69|nr:DUF4129 domain-containing protein [Pseudofrankia sp. DC12]
MAAPYGGPVTRPGAQDEARRELSRSIYGRHHYHRPGWLHRVVDWIDHLLGKIIGKIIGHGPGGGDYTGLGVLAGVLVLVALAVVLRLWLGPVRRSARSKQHEETDLASLLSAKTLRAEAERFAQAGRYAEAVRSRLRAIVRMLEERGVLDPRPSRTAGELHMEVAAVGASGQDELRVAVTVFNDVWYGGRPADATGYQAVVRADEALASMRGGDRRPDPTQAVPA